ncbi:iron ABC transporter permease [Tolypothrix campylonemoides VB511288]|nr:iron ABC transporter permease [Tolypothrix campylonemoides VB511288]
MTAVAVPAPIPTPARRLWPRYALCALAIVALLVGELSLGAVGIGARDVVLLLLGLDVAADAAQVEVWRNIVREFRLPRALNALFSGAALGTAGLLLQTLFRNPLADPFVLGLVHGARLGAAVLVVLAGVAGNALLMRFGLAGDIGLAVASIVGSSAVLLALSALARRVSPVTLLIVGLMLGYLAVGLISVLMHFIDETQASAFKAWDDASFAGATHQQLRLLVPVVVVGLAAAFALVKPLNALLLGERYAQSLGIAVATTRRLALLVVAWLTGIVTAFCGPVAFLGIVSAQVARALFLTSDHRLLLPAVMLIGGALGLAADWITHMPWARHVFHLNAVIGLVGAPVALWLLLRSRAMRGFE